MKPVTATQGAPDWFAARLGVATGSNFDAVQAEIKSGEASTRKNYRIKLSLERVTGVVEETFKSQAMLDGTEREPEARKLYESRKNELVEEIGFCLHDTLECGVSPDGLVGSNGLIEIKCPSQGTHFEYMQIKGEPSAYTAQIQGQLWVMGREWCDFVSYHPSYPEGSKIICHRVYRNEEYIKRLADKVAKFMDEVRQGAEFIRNHVEVF